MASNTNKFTLLDPNDPSNKEDGCGGNNTGKDLPLGPSSTRFSHEELTLSYMCDPNKAFNLPANAPTPAAPPSPTARCTERNFFHPEETPPSAKKRTREMATMPQEGYHHDGDGLGGSEKKTRRDSDPPTVGLPSHGPTTALALSLPSSDNLASSDNHLSLSHSFFSHNPSCSLTEKNYSTEYFDSRDTDSIRYHLNTPGGEGTNGSVHSRLRPIEDGTHTTFSRRSNGSNGSYSFFPSVLPARLAGAAIVKMQPEHILSEIVSEPVPIIARKLNELPSESIEDINGYLRGLIVDPGKKGELVKLQGMLERRAVDLTFEVLWKSNEKQLNILVATRTGMSDFVDGAIPRRKRRELIEIFLHLRCRNGVCNSMLPVEDCECKMCSGTKGFCAACMCPVCMRFDCAQSTCTWVGCDVCSHWCHASCGLEKNLIRSGPSLGGPGGTSEVLFYCLGCGHASEMFGFAKDAFMGCAKDWGHETLKRELACIVSIFQVSDDSRGKALLGMTQKVLTLLERELVSTGDACRVMLQFFQYGKSELPVHTVFRGDSTTATLTSVPSSMAMGANVSHVSDTKEASNREMPGVWEASDETASLSRLPKAEGFENFESKVKLKHAEAALFKRKADDAQREVEAYCQIFKMHKQKLEEEYANKVTKLCLKEVEERRRRKQVELKLLEDSYRDYYGMKDRMEAEMEGLLKRMAMTKQHLVLL